MMAGSMTMKVNSLALLMICMVLVGASFQAMAQLTCCQVKPALEACKCYARNGGDIVPADCCNEVYTLRNELIKSAQDQRTACHCILDAAHKMTDINTTAFSVIPDRCGIRLTYQFNVHMDCDSL